MPFPIEPRPPKPLYEPTWWEKRWPWLLDVLSFLDLEPLWKRLRPLWRPVEAVVGFVFIPLSGLLEAVWQPLVALRDGVSGFGWAFAARLPLPGPVRDHFWLRKVEPNRPLEHDAHAVLKRQYKDVRRWALIGSIALHGSVITFWPTLEAEDFSSVGAVLEAIEIPPDVRIPPPPEPIARPATPVISAVADFDEDITIAPTTFEDNPVRDLPPPPVETAEDGVEDDEPHFTPFTVAPSILNRDEIARHLVAEFPDILRDAGVGGTVVVWFYVSEEGLVERTRIFQSSGHRELDEAALRVAEVFRFSPALNRDIKTAVWVRFPIEFTVN